MLIKAKNYILVPSIINFYRTVDKSLSRKEKNVAETLRERIKEVIENFQYLNKFLSEQEFFQKNSDLKYALLENSTLDSFYYLGNIYDQVPLYKLYEIACSEFEKYSDLPALTALFFGRMNFFNIRLFKQIQK